MAAAWGWTSDAIHTSKCVRGAPFQRKAPYFSTGEPNDLVSPRNFQLRFQFLPLLSVLKVVHKLCKSESHLSSRPRAKCSTSLTLYGAVTRQARSTQDDTGDSITEILLEFPESEAFAGMSNATAEVFQFSIARFCDRSEAKNVVQALGSWRSALSKGSLAVSESWPPEPLRSQLQVAMKDLELPALMAKRPELIDSLLLNILEVVEAAQRQQSHGAGFQPKEDDLKDPNEGSPLQMPGLPIDFLDSAGLPSEALEEVAKTEKELQTDANRRDLKAVPAENEEWQEGQEGQEGQQGHQGQQGQNGAMQFLIEFLKKIQLQAAEAEPDDTAQGESIESWDLDFESRQANESSYFALYRQLSGRLPELRNLIRKMGRKAGLGILRFQEAQREDARAGDGILRSPQMPSETSGITRSDGSLLLLPSELSLLAYANAHRSNSAGAKALHRLRRAEASLLSYERSAWMEEKAKSLRNKEFRPAFNRGPLICCVDTSRSMAGKVEAVAKAAVLEILRLAESERRRCFLFFFSGPNQLEELEIPPPPIAEGGWQGVLDFLSRSFRGTTDLDAPLAASIRCLETNEWQTADILLVTDSKVEQPSTELVEKLQTLREQNGLRIFGLLILQKEIDEEKEIRRTQSSSLSLEDSEDSEDSNGIKVLDELCDEVPDSCGFRSCKHVKSCEDVQNMMSMKYYEYV
eukprot:Skav207646  [mRNA]  locus=scaffold4320:68919:70994:+ [translate_table: standard]